VRDENLAKNIGNLVRHLRLELGISQEAFADLCDLHRTYIGSIERGEKTITIETANKLANAFGLSLSEFFKNLEVNKPSDRK
jgi:transcriptional regulator with XRE-family HTH domain